MSRSNNDTQLSKALSWILRHGAKKEGISVSSEGYIDVDTLLQHKLFKQKYHKEDIQRVVSNNDKQRFKLRVNPSSNRQEIKANQGHSICEVVDNELNPILEPKYLNVVHGTYFKNWPNIKSQGLCRMTRNHIHFSKGTLDDRTIISGIRKGVQLYIFIDLEKALKDGLKFYESENGVILTPGNEEGFLEPKYFLKVVDVNTGFPPAATIADLHRLFSSFGPMRVIKMDSSYATLWFQNHEDTEKVLARKTFKMGEYHLQIIPQHPNIPRVNNYNNKKPKRTQVPAQPSPPNTNSATGAPGASATPGAGSASATPGAGSASATPGAGSPRQPPTTQEHWRRRQGDSNKRQEIEDYKAEAQSSLVEPTELDFSGDFNTQVETIINSIRLTREEVEKLYTLYVDVEHSLQTIWPGCVAVPFGSITTGLGVKSSDADCYIRLPAAQLPASGAHVLAARDVLAALPELFARVLAVPRAATPIVKLLHVPTNTFCDVSVRSPLGVRNSRLLAHLLSADDKFVPLCLLLKYWARVRRLSGTGKLTNYALVLLVVFYLQRTDRLPAVRALQAAPHAHCPAELWDAGFCADRALLPAAPPASLRSLLFGFFRFYSAFDFTRDVVCPYLGEAVPKKHFLNREKLSAFPLYRSNVAACRSLALNTRRVCVQDPFEHSRNVSACVSATVWALLAAGVRAAARPAPDRDDRFFLPELLLAASPVPAVVVTVTRARLPRPPPPARRTAAAVLRLLRDVLRLSLRPDAHDDYRGTLRYDVFDRKPFEDLFRGRGRPALSAFDTQRQITDTMIRLGAAPLATELSLRLRVFRRRGVYLRLEHTEGDPEPFVSLGQRLQASLASWLKALLEDEWEDLEAEWEEEVEEVEEEECGEGMSQDMDEGDDIDIQLDELAIT